MAQHHRCSPACPVGVHAESSDAGVGEREVALVLGEELLAFPLAVHGGQHHRFSLLGTQGIHLEGPQVTGNTEDRLSFCADVDVRGTVGDSAAENRSQQISVFLEVSAVGQDAAVCRAVSMRGGR